MSALTSTASIVRTSLRSTSSRARGRSPRICARPCPSGRNASSQAGSGARGAAPQLESTARPGLVAVTIIAALGLGATYLYTRPIQLDGPAKRSGKTKPPSSPDPDGKAMMAHLQSNSAPGTNAGGQAGAYISMKDVAQHNLAQDAWVVIEGKVYDVTNFHKSHPGGSAIIVSNAGRDVTEIYAPVHPPGTIENNLAPENFKGMIDPVAAAQAREAFQAERQKLAEARDALPPVETMLGLDEMQAAAESCMAPMAISYYGGAALDEITLRDNRSCFQKCRLVPRVMRDVLSVRPQTKIFGIDSALPIYISPASNALLGHPDGELNIVRGASRTGIVQGVSAAASYSLTDILDEKDKMDEESGTKMGMVYQVYIQADRSKTEAQVREAVASGVQALLLTVDANVLGHRQSTEKVKGTKGSAEPGIKMDPIDTAPFYHDARQSWGDLPWLKELAQGTPIYLKGVCHIDDVRLAKEHGLAGCILSNHGGRQLDQARTGFDSLRAIHAEDPELLKQTEVYVDGGIRRGTDVLQAIAFGARGVGLGRPFLYAQAAYGEKGVIRAIRILEDEIVMAMRLLGATSLDQVDASMVECLQEVWK